MTGKKKTSKKRKRHAPPGIDPNERRRERLEARREKKAQEMVKRRRAERRARLVRAVMLVGLVLFAFWFLFLRTRTPDAIAGYDVQKYSQMGLNRHTNDPVSYEMSPPVSGPHAPNPAPCGLFGAPVPNENLVHSLEHGAVGLLYDPERIELDDIKQIEAIAGDFDENVLSMPFTQEMEQPITAIAWGHAMPLPRFDEDALREFIDVFAGEGPESGQTCPGTSNQPFQPQPEPTPEPTPEEDETPEDED